jgi:hypothetical protein
MLFICLLVLAYLILQEVQMDKHHKEIALTKINGENNYGTFCKSI